MVCIEFHRNSKHWEAVLKPFTQTQASSIKDVATHHPVPPEAQLEGSASQQPQLTEARVLYSGSALCCVDIWFIAICKFYEDSSERM